MSHKPDIDVEKVVASEKLPRPIAVTANILTTYSVNGTIKKIMALIIIITMEFQN